MNEYACKHTYICELLNTWISQEYHTILRIIIITWFMSLDSTHPTLWFFLINKFNKSMLAVKK